MWPAFTDHLSVNIGPITAIDGPIQLEIAVRQVTERVSDSLRYATNTSRAVDSRPFIPREVRDLIREKNGLRRQWQRTLNSVLKAKYNQMASRIQVALDEFRNQRWDDFIIQASESSSAFWSAVKVMKEQSEEDEDPLRPTSPEEMKAIIKAFRYNTAPRPDDITYRTLKHARSKFVMHLTNICNAMLRLQYFPSQWKQANVAMIPKPGQPPN
ncbi:hypothetical protein Trydic_g632 [Trypoxylus dichotomus]